MDWNGRKVLVLGLGDTGLSMTRWLARHGARVTVADSRAQPPHARVLEIEHPDVRLTTGAFAESAFAGVDAIAISPGIDRRDPLVADAIRRGVSVVGDIEIFAQALPDIVKVKARVLEGRGVQVLNRLDPWSSGMACGGRRVVTFGLDAPRSARDWGITTDGTRSLARGEDTLMPVSELPVAGLHNAANALAVLALGHAVGIPIAPMLEGLRRFRGLPHRLEKVAEIKGITFYDDSKGTNVGATVAALNGMTTPVVLIAGGDGKSQDFSPIAAAAAARARAVVLIGRDAGLIERALAGSKVPVLRAVGVDEAVETAYRTAAAGDAVLLSPACASYDMFRSYVHRGEVFVQAVRDLAKREEGNES